VFISPSSSFSSTAATVACMPSPLYRGPLAKRPYRIRGYYRECIVAPVAGPGAESYVVRNRVYLLKS